MEDPKYTPEELNAAYDQAAQGTEQPKAGWFECPVCERAFTFVIGQENEVCEHVYAELKKLGPLRVQ
jgi:hypothetical protein